MVKKVRFNDEVQINQMSINLSDHIKEIKYAKDIILDPDKITSKVTSTATVDPDKITSEKSGSKEYGSWIWLVFLIIIIILVGFIVNARVNS